MIKLDIDSKGEPYLEISGHYLSNDMEEKLLSLFINSALEKGLIIEKQGGIGDYCFIKIRRGDKNG